MKTVKVRIALAITDDGAWIADGHFDDGTGRTREAHVMAELIDMAKKMFNPPIELHWIEAEVPVPAALEPKTIPGTSRPQKSAAAPDDARTKE